jgi:hypothetical protein
LHGAALLSANLLQVQLLLAYQDSREAIQPQPFLPQVDEVLHLLFASNSFNSNLSHIGDNLTDEGRGGILPRPSQAH